jgi:hypothetical protein
MEPASPPDVQLAELARRGLAGWGAAGQTPELTREFGTARCRQPPPDLIDLRTADAPECHYPALMRSVINIVQEMYI